MSDKAAGDSCEETMSNGMEDCNNLPLWATTDLVQKPTNEWCLEDLVNVNFQTVDEAEKFYNTYAFVTGFSIRKDRLKMIRDIVSMRKFVCSKAGFRQKKNDCDEGSSTTYSRLVTRCGCLASFKVKYSVQDSAYYPVEFKTMHNHDLAPPNSSHFLRSQRVVDEFSAHKIAELRAVGIKPSKIMDVLVNSNAGYEWVGFTRKDLYNHVYTASNPREKKHDTHLAMQYIQAVAVKDPGVYCRYSADEEGRLTRIYYSDTISRSEYRAFGDVIVCDSTYNTNTYKLPFVFIVGADNHHSTVVFACALVSDETHDTYCWLFQTFLECMECKQPVSIVTDGDRAMRSAIAQVIPKARHRLCGWHLLRNANGICKHPSFKTHLSRLITKRYAVPVFNQKWKMFLEKYGLDVGDRKWVNDMQQSCHLWAETFFTNCFYAGMVTNGRAESTNNKLKGFVNLKLPLSQFFHKYLLFLDSLRQTAMGLECLNSQAMPAVADDGFQSVRTQLSQLYTIQIYKKVDREISRSHLFRAELLNLIVGSPQLRFSVQRYDGGEGRNMYEVTWVTITHYLTCSCGLVESVGYPCAHIFSVMKQRNICHLGPQNLTTRWAKDARSMCVLSSSYARHITGPAHRLTTIRPYCDTLAYLSSVGDDHMQLAQREIDSLCKRLYAMGHPDPTLIETEENFISSQFSHTSVIGDPKVANTKGAPRGRRASTRRHCTICKHPGHTKRTCDSKKCDDNEEDDGDLVIMDPLWTNTYPRDV